MIYLLDRTCVSPHETNYTVHIPAKQRIPLEEVCLYMTAHICKQ